VLADGPAPLRRSAAHSREIFSAYFVVAAQIAGSDRRPVFSVARAIFRPLPIPPTTASFGTKTSSNGRQGVLDAAQAHEGVAGDDLDARRVARADERGDAALGALGLRDDAHDDHDVGDGAVRRPQLRAR
jgi:hypothetical protein